MIEIDIGAFIGGWLIGIICFCFGYTVGKNKERKGDKK